MAGHGAFHRVGDDLATHERVVHALVVHGDAVAHPDGGNLEGHAAGHIDAGLHGLADLVKVGVPGDDVVARIDDGDEGALHLLVGDTVGLQQAPMRRAGRLALDLVAAQCHWLSFLPVPAFAPANKKPAAFAPGPG